MSNDYWLLSVVFGCWSVLCLPIGVSCRLLVCCCVMLVVSCVVFDMYGSLPVVASCLWVFVVCRCRFLW